MPITTGPANLVKAQILANLQSLVTAGVLGAILEQEITANVLKIDFPSYPCAVLGSSSVKSKYLWQQTNQRTYQFDILIVQLVDNLPSSNPGYMEDLRDAIATQFDNNFTLAGTALVGINAVYSQKNQTTEQGKKFVTFIISLQANALANLTYSF